MYRNINILKAGGVELRGMKASLAPRRQQAQAPPKLEQYTFIPYDNTIQSKVGLCHTNHVTKCLCARKCMTLKLPLFFAGNNRCMSVKCDAVFVL